jgi:hypothetical protein
MFSSILRGDAFDAIYYHYFHRDFPHLQTEPEFLNGGVNRPRQVGRVGRSGRIGHPLNLDVINTRQPGEILYRPIESGR